MDGAFLKGQDIPEVSERNVLIEVVSCVLCVMKFCRESVKT